MRAGAYDLRTAAGANAWLAEVFAGTREDWMRLQAAGEPFAARAYVMASVDPRTGEAAPMPVVVGIVAPTYDFRGDVKDAFIVLYKRVATELGAVGTLFIGEMWMVVAATGEDISNVALAEHPARREVLFATMEHRRVGQVTYIASVERAADGTATLGEFEKLAEVKETSGRLTRTLPEHNLS